jgi:hypothetical protein
VVLFFVRGGSTQAEQRQDEHYDYDQTDEINNTIHGGPPKKLGSACASSRSRIGRTGQHKESSGPMSRLRPVFAALQKIFGIPEHCATSRFSQCIARKAARFYSKWLQTGQAGGVGIIWGSPSVSDEGASQQSLRNPSSNKSGCGFPCLTSVPQAIPSIRDSIPSLSR